MRIRARRSDVLDPVAPAGSLRKETFSSSLQQSEDLFRAAEGVDDAVRPILLFYGMSQASRAIAACAEDLGDDDFRLVGHGLRASLTDDATLGNITLSPQKSQRSNFATMQRLLTGQAWTQPTTLAQLWNAHPHLEVPDRGQSHDPLGIQRHVVYEAGWEVEANHPHMSVTFTDIRAEHLGNPPSDVDADKLANTYPAIRFTEAAASGEPRNQWLIIGEGRYSLRRYINEHSNQISFNLYGDIARPGLGGSDLHESEFTCWWSLLFALSMRARYEPVAWRHDLDPDSSKVAVPLEGALRLALEICPAVIDSAIAAVSHRK